MNSSFLSKNLLNGGGGYVNVKQKINSQFFYNEFQLHEQEFIEQGEFNVKQKMNSLFLYNELQLPEQEFIERWIFILMHRRKPIDRAT